MRRLLTILLLFAGLAASAQADSAGLKASMQMLDKALMEKDSMAAFRLLHKDASYGHSNGWVQSKNDVFADMRTGKLVYQKIMNTSVQVLAMTRKWATVKTLTNVEGSVNGNAFNLSLHVMQVWMKTKTGWQLFGRQSAKL